MKRVLALSLAVAACSSDETTSTPKVDASNSVGAVDSGSVADATVPTNDGGAQVDAGQNVDGGKQDAGAATGCNAMANIFCDNFESYPVGALTAGQKWTADTSGGSFAIDTSNPKTGTKALHLLVNGNGRALANIANFSAPGNSFYGRMHTFVKAFPTAPVSAHWTMFELAGGGPDRIRPIGGQFVGGGVARWGTGSDGGPTGDWTRTHPSAPTENAKWVCMEWQVAATNSEMHVWIDGVAKPSLDASTKNHGGNNVDLVFPTFTKAWFGWWMYQANPTPATFDIMLDDVALGTQRIGCL